jgi:hypothetical protein
MRVNSLGACSGARVSGRAPAPSFVSSTSGLPEKQVRADRGAHHSDDRHQIFRLEQQRWPNDGPGYLIPRHVHNEGADHIAEQRQAPPFQDGDVACVAGEDLQPGRERTEQHDVDQGGAADQQLQRRAHRAEIGAQVDQIGGQQQQDDAPRQPRRVVPAQIAGDAEAGDATDPRANLLDRCHQRVAEHQRPGQAVPELRADLRIGGDAAGVVIRRPGDQARPQHLEQLSAGRLPGLVAHRVVRHVVPPVRLSGPYGRQLANATSMSWWREHVAGAQRATRHCLLSSTSTYSRATRPKSRSCKSRNRYQKGRCFLAMLAPSRPTTETALGLSRSSH